MIITSIGKKGIYTISLPQRIKGQYWLYEAKENGEDRLVDIEGINNQWFLKSNRHYKILDSQNGYLKTILIEPANIYVLEKTNGERIFILSEKLTEDRQIFEKYDVGQNTELTIGRNEQCDICYANRIVSSKHAILAQKNGKWMIKDTKSSNGIFVNGVRVEGETALSIGDTIFVMGLKIIIGKGLIALNKPDGLIRLSDKLQKYTKQPLRLDEEEYEYELAEPEYFYRSPRFKRDIESASFRVDSPPTSPITEEMPFILVIGSSLAMGMMSMVTLVSAIANNNVMSMVMGASMLIGTLFLPIITKRYEKKQKKKKEALRQKKYHEYLDKVSIQIQDECRLQEEILNENGVTIQECEERIINTSRNLWERDYGQNDFLKIRVGQGKGLLDAEIKYAERRFTLDDDNLQDIMYSLCEEEKILNNIPITYSLFENTISGVIGERESTIEFAKSMIIQLAALYSYEDVKFVVLYDKTEQDAFSFVKWLPHVWSEEKRFRFIATSPNEIKEVSSYFEKIIEERSQLNSSEVEDAMPYYIVFSMSKSLAFRSEMVKSLLSKKDNLHFSVVNIYEQLNDLPRECSMVVELKDGKGRLFDKNDISGKNIEFQPDGGLRNSPHDLSIRLANTILDNTAGSFKLPAMITFMQLFGVGKVEHLNALTRWKENDPTKTLEAAVGIDTYGELFKLDLHEKFHGPHGLVAGMTGSGKSEFIITYILSLAVNYHPEEVAFVLIDYKGGGMAKSFEKLPHTAGIITNLDGAAIKRSLVSIESELKRRQALFAEASKAVSESNIDIYKYQKLYRQGTVEEPLPHLFIISDEFAELKTQQPEFMEKLVSAARIGRSLGVHLILATQKPSGVVDDQIWSNSKFRVCLKVQERADSMDMLKRPDAAELVDTGRFYLQVGYNELFELGQSAWAGAPYYPSDKVVIEKDNSVSIIDMNGHVVRQVKPDNKRNLFTDAKKQLDVITGYLTRTAEDEGIKIKRLWLDPIPEVILLDEVREKYGCRTERFVLNPVIGEYDDPAHQCQDVLRLPISKEGNAVIYGSAGSGKTTFLNALIYSLMREHTPEEVNLYILDFASETLKAFSKAPHVGEVILSYEAEKVSNLFKMLKKELEDRKKLFADYGGDYASYIEASGEVLPSIVVAINNFAAFTESYDEKEDAVRFLSREGSKYGIYFILTALGHNDVRFRLLQNFNQLLTLQMNDESDYAMVVGKTEGLYPSKYKGRGLIRKDNLYEFQLARLTDEEIPYRFIQSVSEESAKNWSGEFAKKIPILPQVVNTEFIKDYVRSDDRLSIPIGVEKNTLRVHQYSFEKSYVNMILSAGQEYQGFMKPLAELLGKIKKRKGFILDAEHIMPKQVGTLQICTTLKACEEKINELFDLLVYRNNTYKDAMEQGIEIENFEPIVVIIPSIIALRNSISSECEEKLVLVLEKGRCEYKVNFIIGDQVKSMSSVSYEKWYKTQVPSSEGIWIGGGITEQYLMKPKKTTSEMHETITSEFGFVLTQDKCIKTKLIREMMEDNRDE